MTKSAKIEGGYLSLGLEISGTPPSVRSIGSDLSWYQLGYGTDLCPVLAMMDYSEVQIKPSNTTC